LETIAEEAYADILLPPLCTLKNCLFINGYYHFFYQCNRTSTVQFINKGRNYPKQADFLAKIN
jgi:hypothetical protein